MSKSPTDALRKLQFLQWMSWLEGGTLLLLLLVAVPLKRLAGIPEVVSWVGPVHGGAFLVYIAMVLVVTSAKPWTSLDSLKLLLAAFIPFGAWMVSGSFKRVATELAATKGAAGTRP